MRCSLGMGSFYRNLLTVLMVSFAACANTDCVRITIISFQSPMRDATLF
jgi:hypothetical protein